MCVRAPVWEPLMIIIDIGLSDTAHMKAHTLFPLTLSGHAAVYHTAGLFITRPLLFPDACCPSFVTRPHTHKLFSLLYNKHVFYCKLSVCLFLLLALLSLFLCFFVRLCYKLTPVPCFKAVFFSSSSLQPFWLAKLWTHYEHVNITVCVRTCVGPLSLTSWPVLWCKPPAESGMSTGSCNPSLHHYLASFPQLEFSVPPCNKHDASYDPDV